MTLSLRRTYQELRWADDMDPSAAETASDLESLEQDVLHIISERLGSNLADPQSGVGAVDYLSGTSAELAGMPAIIDTQLANVSRIASSQTTLTLQADGSYLITVAVTVGADIATLQFALGPNGLTKA
jgi:hypothetical protein